MASTLQLVDDSGAVLFDFNTSSGTGNPNSLVTAFAVGGGLDLLGSSPELVIASGDSAPGGAIVRRRDPLAQVVWNQLIGTSGTTYDNLAAGIGELARLLAKNGRLKWIAHGSSQTRYIEFEGTSTPVRLLDGRELGLWQACQQGYLAEGVQIALLAYPYLLEAELSPQAYLTNPTLLYDFGGTANRPDGWAWTDVTGLSGESISSTHQAYQFTKANAGPHDLQETTANSTFASGDVAVFSFYARVTAVAGTPRAQAVVEFLTNAGASVGGAQTGTLTTLTTAWQRLTVTTAAAGATTGKARVSLRTNNADGTSVQVEWRNAQLEKTSLTTFRTAAETVAADPASTSQPRRMMVYAAGDAPSRAEVKITADSSTLQRVTIYRESTDPVSYLKATLHKQAESGTLSNNTSSTADANASGGNTAQTTFSLLDPSFGTDASQSGTLSAGGLFTLTPPTVSEGQVLLVITEQVSSNNPQGFHEMPLGFKFLGQASTDGVASSSSAESTLYAAYKIITANEPTTYTFRSNSATSSRYRAWAIPISNIDTDNPIAGVTFNNSTSAGTTATALGITTVRDKTAIVVGIGAAHGANTPNPISTPAGATPTFTEQDDGNTGVVTSGFAADTGVLATAGATGDKTATLNASSDWVTCMIALNPAPGPLLERVRQTWTSIPAGTYELVARVYPTAASSVRIRTEWSLMASPTVWNTMLDYVLDTTSASTFEYALVTLGRISIPEEWALSTLTIKISLGLEDYATPNFRTDWLDLVPCNEFKAQLESTAIVASGEFLVGDGVLPKVFHLDTGSALKPLGEATNIPVVLEPGFNLLTILPEQEVLTGWIDHRALLSASPTVAVSPTPSHRT